MLPTPRDFSQGATSFIASQCQGIHQMPFSRLLSSNLAHAGAKPAGNGGAAARDQGSEVRDQMTPMPNLKNQVPSRRPPSRCIAERKTTQGSAKPPGRNPATRSEPEDRGQNTEDRHIPAPGLITSGSSPRNASAPRRTSRTLFTMSTNPMPEPEDREQNTGIRSFPRARPRHTRHGTHITKPINPDALRYLSSGGPGKI